MTRSSALALVLALPGLALPLLAAPLGACHPVQRPDGGHGHLEVGDPAPELRAVDHRGTEVALAALRGAPVLVYFYPKDDTPGCTREACAIRDVWTLYTDAGVVVLGVSSDDDASHRKFADEYRLPFSLIADPELVWARAFGAESSFKIIHRTSYLIDREGKVAKVYVDVDPGVHANEVLADVAKLPGAAPSVAGAAGSGAPSAASEAAPGSPPP